MNWYFKAFKNYFNFKGRARRKEFWMFILFQIILVILISFIIFFFKYIYPLDEKYNLSPLIGLFLLISTFPIFSVAVRRFHDTGRSGLWLIALFFIPIANIFALIYLLEKGSIIANKYGENSKNNSLN
ncbi:MAG: DUF805 domain-containing protein [Aequorivita sp.]|nr:DUF805 domain-containing protein [Aequorivita sp.]